MPELGFASLSIQTDDIDTIQASQMQVVETDTNESETEYTDLIQANEAQANEIETSGSEAPPAPTIPLRTSNSLSAKFSVPDSSYQYRKRIVEEIDDYLRSHDMSISSLYASLSHAKRR
jgi:hypothetical protein